MGIKDYYPFIISLDFVWKLLKLKPEVIVIPGWSDMPSYISALYCFFTGHKLVLRSESTAYERSFRRTFFMPIAKLMIKMADAYITSGTRAKEYLVSLGANPQNVFVGYSPIDVDYFQEKSTLSATAKANIRSKMGVTSKSKVVLFVGQLIIRKGVFDLINAFAPIAFDDLDAVLVFIGYGPELNNLKHRARELNIQNKVIFIDFVPNEELPCYFAASDIFVLPSHEETWGIVVNEAMACGLPVIVNSLVGSSSDLVKNNQNGYLYSSANPKSLEKLIRILLINSNLRKLMSFRSREIAKRFNFNQLIEAFIQSIGATL